jgi:type IV pilus assembly protein PilB
LIRKGIAMPNGIVLTSGPTGSGKSTTLYSALTMLNKPGVNIMTLEDPVENQVDGINQSQVKPQIGYTFASGLRTALRQDPDIIMV